MYQHLGWTTLLVSVVLLFPSAAPAQKKPGDKKGAPKQETATPQDYAYVSQMKEVVGRLIAFDTGTKTLTLRLEYQHLEPNAKAKNPKQNFNDLQQQQRLMQEYQQIMRIQNPMQRAQRLEQFYAKAQFQQFRDMQKKTGGQNDLFKIVTTTKDFDMNLADELKVARVNLPMEYDDKGNLVQYTALELKKKKDPVLPGYTAKADDLQAYMMVKVYLGKKKDSGTTKKEAAKIDEQPGRPVLVQEKDRPHVRMILIQSDPDPSFRPNEPKKKKKN